MTLEERAQKFAENIIYNASWSDIEYHSDAQMAIEDIKNAYIEEMSRKEFVEKFMNLPDDLEEMKKIIEEEVQQEFENEDTCQQDENDTCEKENNN